MVIMQVFACSEVTNLELNFITLHGRNTKFLNPGVLVLYASIGRCKQGLVSMRSNNQS